MRSSNIFMWVYRTRLLLLQRVRDGVVKLQCEIFPVQYAAVLFALCRCAAKQNGTQGQVIFN